MPVGVFGNLGKALDLKRLGMASKIGESRGSRLRDFQADLFLPTKRDASPN